MKKIVIFLIVVALFVTGVISLESQVYGQSSGKVLMMLREGYSADLDFMLKMEVGVMTILLKRAGFQVDVATFSGHPIVGPTAKIEKVMKLSEINLDDYVGVIMPCMSIGNVPVAPEAVAVVKKVLADGKPVAAALGSVSMLAEAGLLKGKKYALLDDPLKTTEARKRPDPRFVDAIYSGSGVVQDGKIITAGGCPLAEKASGVQNRTFELTQTFIAAIGPK
jgi:putative intracellular protease/amidase